MSETDPIIQSRESRSALILSAAMVSLALYVQLYLGSMFDVDDKAWLFRLGIHLDNYPFSARVFTTYPVKWLGEILGGRYELAFGFYQYAIYFLIGPLFYQYLRRLRFDHHWSLTGLLIIYLSYPMLAAFHEPVSSWDDFLQYAALIVAFSSLLTDRFRLSAVAFAFGLAAREATVLIYPVWAIALWFTCSRSPRYKMGLVSLPVLVGGFLWYYPDKEPAAARINSITENFRNEGWARNSLYSLAMGLGFLWMLLLPALRSPRVRKRLQEGGLSFIRYGAIYSVPVVTAVVLNFAYARETRLFFPPFVFVIPLVMVYLYEHRDRLKKFYSGQHRIRTIVIVVVTLLVGTALAIGLFPHFDYRSAHHFARGMFAVHFAFGAMALLPTLRKSDRRL